MNMKYEQYITWFYFSDYTSYTWPLFVISVFNE